MSLSLTINQLIEFIINNPNQAYLILFLGAYVETLIGFSFIVFGEVFFLTGSIMAGAGILNIWLVIPCLMLGAALGDSTSYLLGHKIGVIKKTKSNFWKNNYQKGTKFFKEHGEKSIFLARFLGPAAWIMPFLAGTYNVKYKQFIKYNIPSVILGVGQFIVVGYFLGSAYELYMPIIQKYILIVVISIILLITIHQIAKKKLIYKKIKDKILHFFKSFSN